MNADSSGTWGEGGTGGDGLGQFRPEGAPDGPDFWLLSQAVLQMDGRVESPESRGIVVEVRDLTQGFQIDTITYVAQQRLLRLGPDLRPRDIAVWLDGAVAGILAARKDEENKRREIISPNALAALIREIDGANDKGAGALGEALADRLLALLDKRSED